MRNKRKSSFLAYCSMSLLCALTAGCATQQQSGNTERFFVLEVYRPGQAMSGLKPHVLKVRRFRVSDTFSGNQLIYRTGAMTYEPDFYNKFLASPGSMITDQIIRWLSDSGIFAHVTDTGSETEDNLLLEGNIQSIYGDYSDPKNNLAVIEIRIHAMDTTGAKNTVIFHKTYKASATLKSISPSQINGTAELVKGLNLCLKNIFTEIEGDLRREVK
ncbi:MAG: membrane integrity-associated transporter subunit PqiC [Planctomycetes bacterium]|nr:membrane integrity-associated transporter subunit PqiC [Planctomycetota bacterium]